MGMNRLGDLAGAGVLLTLASLVQAQEVAPRTVLSAATIDTLAESTLDGHRIGDLLLATQELMIREHGWEMTLIPQAEDVPPHPKIEPLTREYAGQAHLDADKNLVNYTTGVPFPELSPEDPDAGIKLAYNILRVGWAGDAIDAERLYFLVIDGEKGYQREQGWRYKRYLMSGRLHEPHVESEEIVKYEALVNVYPQDTKGLGVLTVHYTDGRLPDVYAYVKFARRVRRLSSGTWADPIQSTDALSDETFGMNLHPTWYESWNLNGKRWILGTTHGEVPEVDDDISDYREKYPAMHFDEEPHWNFTEVYEPREVWVLEATPKKDHLVSRKYYYVDTNPYLPRIYWGDAYDRKGELWRIAYVGFKDDEEWDDGHVGLGVSVVSVVDLQRYHATVAYPPTGDMGKVNHSGLRAVDFTPEALPRMLD